MMGCGVWDWHLVARFGFFEIPDLRRALSRARRWTSQSTSTPPVVGSRDLVVHKPQGATFERLAHGAVCFSTATPPRWVDRFNLPPETTVEIARQIEI